MSETEREGRVLTRRTRKALSRYRIDIDVCWIDKIRRAVTRRVRGVPERISITNRI